MADLDDLPLIFEDREIDELSEADPFSDYSDNEVLPADDIPYGAPMSLAEKEEFDRQVEKLVGLAERNTEDSGKDEENDKKKSPEKTKNYEKINEALIFLVIALLVLLIGERYIIQNSKDEISVFYEIVETTTHTAERSHNNDRININTADAEELMLLDGIGEQKANAIIEYRTVYGRFSDIAEITEVTGIGEGIYEKIKDRITVE